MEDLYILSIQSIAGTQISLKNAVKLLLLETQ